MFSKEEEIQLEQLNELLAKSNDFGQNLIQNKEPLIFVSGLPRSGTTLCMQVLAAGLDINYIDNFTARFWKNPVAGMILSKVTGLKNGQISFDSEYGRTKQVNEPHEFSYFWKQHLNYEDFTNYDSRKLTKEIDWKQLNSILSAMSRVESRPLLLKGLHMAKYFSHWIHYNPYFLVITVKKNLVEISNSLLQARIKRNGNKENWWSIMPNDFQLIKDVPYYEQIPNQLKMLENDFDIGLEKVPEAQKMEVDYINLCKEPWKFISDVNSRMKALFKEDTLRSDYKKRVPEKFDPPTNSKVLYDKKLKLAAQEIFTK